MADEDLDIPDIEDGLPGMALATWLRLTGTSYAAFARRLGVALTYPRMLALGFARPSYELACIIEAETGGQVPVARWYPPPPNSKDQQHGDK